MITSNKSYWLKQRYRKDAAGALYAIIVIDMFMQREPSLTPDLYKKVIQETNSLNSCPSRQFHVCEAATQNET